jgi:hypothetical protein
MGLRFRRTVRLIPGVKLNFSRGGTSVSFGTRGFWCTIGPHGRRRTTVSLPGTGMSWTEEHRVQKTTRNDTLSHHPETDLPAPASPAPPCGDHGAEARQLGGRPTWAFITIVAGVIVLLAGISYVLQRGTNEAAKEARPDAGAKARSAQDAVANATSRYQPGAASVKVIVPGTVPKTN